MDNANHKVCIEGLGQAASGLTLYAACRLAMDEGDGDVILDGRLVAFYSKWHNCIRVGFGAYPHELEQLRDDWGKTVKGEYTNT